MALTGAFVRVCAFVALLPVTGGVTVVAQQKPGWTPVSKEQEAMALAMMKAMTPGEPHALLASLAGDWTFTSKMWMDPAAPPQESKGTATYTMLMGGRYLQGVYKGDMAGMAFEGVGVTAYDNTTGQYQSVWMDNLSTMLMFMTGSYDAASRTFTMRTEMADIVDPSIKVKVRELLTIVDRDTHRMEMFETRDGKERKNLELSYTRKK
jgi:hypothetical protein